LFDSVGRRQIVTVVLAAHERTERESSVLGGEEVGVAPQRFVELAHGLFFRGEGPLDQCRRVGSRAIHENAVHQARRFRMCFSILLTRGF